MEVDCATNASSNGSDNAIQCNIDQARIREAFQVVWKAHRSVDSIGNGDVVDPLIEISSCGESAMDSMKQELSIHGNGSAHTSDTLVKEHRCLHGKNGSLLLPDHPGCYIIPNALNIEEQVYWSSMCYSSLPSMKSIVRSNIDALRDSIENMSSMAEKSKAMASLKKSKLTWLTIGMHYDWTKRKYDEKMFSPFPDELAQLCEHFVEKVSYENKTINCEAGIINYYSADGSEGSKCMGGHVDDAEFDYTAPVVSISLGCSCIFIIGPPHGVQGKTSAILLRSGDCFILGGKSRLSLHGVSVVIPKSPSQEYLDLLKEKDKACFDYVTKHSGRININVRQVYGFQ